jgi:hypothetical protein
VKSALTGFGLLALLAAGQATAGASMDRLGERTNAWTMAALATDAAVAPDSTYRLDWQKQLLSFQLEFARSLRVPTDPVQTGSISQAR